MYGTLGNMWSVIHCIWERGQSELLIVGSQQKGCRPCCSFLLQLGGWRQMDRPSWLFYWNVAVSVLLFLLLSVKQRISALNVFQIAQKQREQNFSQNNLVGKAQGGESECVSAVPYSAIDTLNNLQQAREFSLVFLLAWCLTLRENMRFNIFVFANTKYFLNRRYYKNAKY